MTEDHRIGQTDMLLVIDVQNDFCAGGALEVPEGDAVVAPINRLAQRFAHVALTQDWHTPGHRSFASQHRGKAPFETVELPYGSQILWPDHCVQGSRGAEFHPGLDIPHAELVLRKGYRSGIDSYSAFFENDGATPTGLHGYLQERGIERLFMAGLALDVCVRFSAEDGRRLGYPVTAIEEGCRGIDTDGSVAATRASFAELGVAVVPEAQIKG